MDPISNMFSQISNALAVGKTEVVTSNSRFKRAVLEIIKKEGYIEDYKKEKKQNKEFLKIRLKYFNKKPAIKHIKRMSKPGLRVYVAANKIPRPLQGLGLVVLSTNQGVLSNKEARRRRIGGEVICEIY